MSLKSRNKIIFVCLIEVQEPLCVGKFVDSCFSEKLLFWFNHCMKIITILFTLTNSCAGMTRVRKPQQYDWFPNCAQFFNMHNFCRFYTTELLVKISKLSALKGLAHQ